MDTDNEKGNNVDAFPTDYGRNIGDESQPLLSNIPACTQREPGCTRKEVIDPESGMQKTTYTGSDPNKISGLFGYPIGVDKMQQKFGHLLPIRADEKGSDFIDLGALHIRNLIFTRGKLLSNAVILSDDRKAKEPGQLVARMEKLRDDFVHYAKAKKNFLAWEEEQITKKADSSVSIINNHINYTRYSIIAALVESGKAAQVLELFEQREALEELQEIPRIAKRMDEDHEYMREMREEIQEKNVKAKLLQRLSMALFGGLSLIVPMLIMTLHPGRLTALTTTSVFVLSVAIALAWFMKDAQQKDIVAATAAYATVLVVFIGNGSGSGG